jgi:cellulose synthase/poly-beta-1,6-N-acetylglucosamine synthase-like glycosyltransferase
LKAVSELDYPRELLQIQVWDDSTDDTREITVKMVEAYRNAGFDMTYIHRGSRDGYKAGALEHGLNTATGEFVGIFDADFIPPRNWLKRMLPAFNDPSVGCVQSRWGHLNSTFQFHAGVACTGRSLHGGKNARSAQTVNHWLQRFAGSGARQV